MSGPTLNNDKQATSFSRLLASKSSVFTKKASTLATTEQQRLGNTDLHLATAQQRLDIVERLLAQQDMADSANHFGETPLHIAARTGNEAIVKLLLARGANIYKLNNKGETPLYAATETEFSDRKPSHAAIIKLLVAADNKLVPHYKKIWESARGDSRDAVIKLLTTTAKTRTSFWSSGSSEFHETIKYLKANPFITQQNILVKLEENKVLQLAKNHQPNSEAIGILNFSIAMVEHSIAQKEAKYSMDLKLPSITTR